MPTLMPSDTAAALGQNAERCDSRSLLLDRFCDPTAKEDARKQVFTRAMAKAAINAKSAAWISWLSTPTPQKLTLHAQLQSRLMVNMAGGVMENAGLCLDRFGLPYIPGSAVKGCARRAALAALREWCAAGGQPVHKPTGSDNPLAPCCASFSTSADMLAAIARVFGWCELDWSDRSDQSDFRWACAGQTATLKTAAEALAAHFRWPIEDRHRATPWLSLPNFAGSVSFLPAYPADLGRTGRVDGLPLEVPPLGKLELDVVTCHHREYYSGNPAYASAPDTEEPVPVVFPAVAPGHIFTFALVPLRGADESLLDIACTWLKTGLETFGLGAKTNAGYGWFLEVQQTPSGWHCPAWQNPSVPHQCSPQQTSSPTNFPASQPSPQPIQTPSASDYSVTSFKRAVLDLLDKPQNYENLKREVNKLNKPENAEWQQKLIAYLANPDAKEAKKRLKNQPWFPKEWLPQEIP